jgi:hypothetical protein
MEGAISVVSESQDGPILSKKEGESWKKEKENKNVWEMEGEEEKGLEEKYEKKRKEAAARRGDEMEREKDEAKKKPKK